MHHPDTLIELFNSCFMRSHQTQLAYGNDEPLYQPADAKHPYHTIYFANGFFSSALLEIAHWLLAGKARRGLLDYGYWYVSGTRSQAEQVLFQQVEVKPQAMEWILSKAAGFRFQFSFDNLEGASIEQEHFQALVAQQCLSYEQNGLPPRAHYFQQALLGYYQVLKSP